LDADALIDEFRRQVESGLPSGQPYTFREPVLERRRQPLPGEPRGWGPWPVIGAVVLAAVAGLLVIGVVGSDDEGGRDGKRAAKQERKQRQERRERRQERRQERQQAAEEAQESGTVSLRLELNSDVQVCLLGAGQEQPLIDDQLLSAGSEEGPYEASSFELRFPFGYDREQFDLFLNGEKRRVPETEGPTAYKISAPSSVKPAEPAEACP
jgi:hypothetical protein